MCIATGSSLNNLDRMRQELLRYQKERAIDEDSISRTSSDDDDDDNSTSSSHHNSRRSAAASASCLDVERMRRELLNHRKGRLVEEDSRMSRGGRRNVMSKTAYSKNNTQSMKSTRGVVSNSSAHVEGIDRMRRQLISYRKGNALNGDCM